MIKSPKLPNPLHRRCLGVLGTDELGRLRRFLGVAGVPKRRRLFSFAALCYHVLDVFMITKWLLSCFWLFLVPIMCFVLFSHLFGFQAISAAPSATGCAKLTCEKSKVLSTSDMKLRFLLQIWKMMVSGLWNVGLESRFWIIQIFSWLFKSSFGG